MFVRITPQIVVNPDHIESIHLWKYKKSGQEFSFVQVNMISGQNIKLNRKDITIEDVIRALGGHGPIEGLVQG